jgi:hypothetical protein
VAFLCLIVAGTAQPPAAPRVAATRLQANPLVTVKSSASLGDNVNGPAVIRVPSWVTQPLGRYYMYFAHHKGEHIRLAYADSLTGPWRIHEPGVLNVAQTIFDRERPDPPGSPEGFYTHVASPEILIEPQSRRLTLWVHGWWTNGERWPLDARGARAWAGQHGYGQYTQSAVSTDGLRFAVRPEMTRVSYLRVFPHDGRLYGMARLGRLMRSHAADQPFEAGPNPFAGSAYADRIRHVALLQRPGRLHVFFTAIGDAPERVLMSTIDLHGDWTMWKASAPVEVLRPDAPYECPTLPISPSEAGDIEGPARQLRDPAIFEEDARTWLFYTICGEQGIAGAELKGF